MQKPPGLILAGGLARRLDGADKGLIPIKDKPLIEHVINRIRNQVCDIVISANNNLETYRHYGYSVIEDSVSNFQGPLSGIATAMDFIQSQPDKRSTHEYCLVAACDMPLYPLDFYQRACKKNTAAENKRILVAHDGERLQPLCMLVPFSLSDDIQNHLASQHNKLEAWVMSHDPVMIDYSDNPNAFCNVNSTRDIDQLNSLLS